MTPPSIQRVRIHHPVAGREMVVIELEPEPEEPTRPSPPAPEEAVGTKACGEAVRPSSPPAPEEQAAAASAAGGEVTRAEEGKEEEAFEDALTDEQLREDDAGDASDGWKKNK